MQFNNLCLYSSGIESSCHAVVKRVRKFSVTGEGSKGQAETSTNGMSLSTPFHENMSPVCEVFCGSRALQAEKNPGGNSLEVIFSLYAFNIATVNILVSQASRIFLYFRWEEREGEKIHLDTLASFPWTSALMHEVQI